MGPIEIFTFGGMRLSRSEADLTEQMGTRHRALLIYLVCQDSPVPRRELLALLGRGGSAEREMKGLRRAIDWLNENVPGLGIELTKKGVRVSSDISLDVHQLSEAIRLGKAEVVHQLYLGEFLEGFESLTEPFDDWVRAERLRWKQAWSEAIRTAAANTARGGDAARWWKILVDREPLAGDAVAGLIYALAQTDDQDAASLAYAGYAARLKAAGMTAPAEPVKQVVERLSLPEPGSGAASVSPSRAASHPSSTPRQDQSPVAHGVGAVGRPRSPRSSGSADSSELFTDSAFVYVLKTAWARVTTPRALIRYRDSFDRLLAVSIEIGQALFRLTVALGRAGITLARSTWRGLGAARRALKRKPRAPKQARAKPAPQPLSTKKPSVKPAAVAKPPQAHSVKKPAVEPAAAKERAPRAEVATEPKRESPAKKVAAARMEPTAEKPAKKHRRGRREERDRGRKRRLATVSRSVASQAGSFVTWLGAVALWVGSLAARAAAGARRVLSAVLRVGPAITWLSRLAARGVRAVVLLRRHPLPAALLLATLVAWFAPATAWDWSARRALQMQWKIASLYRASLADVSMPTVTIPKLTLPRPTVPKLNISKPSVANFSPPLPDLVEETLTQLEYVLAGPLVEPGARVVVADVETDGDNSERLGEILALALEAELGQSRYYTLIPRERVLSARESGTGRGLALSTSEAIALATATRAALVITGSHSERDGLQVVRLAVLDSNGEELYGVESAMPTTFDALDESARSVRRRLGESTADIISTYGAMRLLSPSSEALSAYARAREQLYAGRYSQAIAAAQSAIRHDSAFAAAQRTLADAYALAGQRSRASRALDAAWRFRTRLSERERLRVSADRQAFAGKLSEAFLAYDRLFTLYRDDVGALKSQAVLQEMIGARGGGIGNLRVAYSIDHQDWPPLSRVARFLGYRGRLPDVDLLIEESRAATDGR